MQEWNVLLNQVMKNTKNEWCKDYDACPLEGYVLNIDGYASSRSKLPWMSYSDWAFKAAIASMSDIIVSGGKPLAILYSVGTTNENELTEVSIGIGKASEYLNSIVLKGDSNKAKEDPWIDVVAVGKSNRIVNRKGAKIGDYLVQIGYLGYGTISQKILEKKLKIDNVEKKILMKTIIPDFQINAWEPISKYASSSSDNSDGWISTLYNISKSSNVGIILDSIEIDPMLKDLITEEEALNSWEDYNFAVTVSEENLDDFLNDCTDLNIRCFVIGKIREGHGVIYNNKKLDDIGWTW